MKVKLIIIILFLTVNSLFSQTIEDFFIFLPEKLMDSLSTNERQELLDKKIYKPTITDSLEIVKFELRKYDNSIVLEMGYETGQRGFIYWEFKKWDYPNKTIYVVAQASGVPTNWNQNFIISYEWGKNSFILLKHQIPNNISITEFLDPLTPNDTIKKIEEYSTLHCDLIYDAKNPVWRIVVDFKTAGLSRKWVKYKDWEFYDNAEELKSKKIELN